jgi:hypothetical protein
MTDSPENSVEVIGWSAFMARPATYIDRSRLSACFGAQIGNELCGRLQGAIRLQHRLSILIDQHYSLASTVASEALSELARSIALASAERLAEYALRSGAIYWAATIVGAVRAREVKAFQQELGEALCTYALTHRDLAGPSQQVEPLDSLGARIAEDGWRCLGAWCHAQPDGVGARVRLKLAASHALDDPPQSPFDKIGPPIVRRVAG